MVQQRGIRKRPKAVRVAEIKAIFQSCGTNLAALQTLSVTSNLQQFDATDQYKKARLQGAKQLHLAAFLGFGYVSTGIRADRLNLLVRWTGVSVRRFSNHVPMT